MVERNDRGRSTDLRGWVLMRLNRWVLTGVVLGVVYGLLVAASYVQLSPARRIVEEHDGAQVLFTAFIGAIITGTSIVVTINQLVLSQELGAVGKQRSRMQEAMSFRRDVEETMEPSISSPYPAAFLQELLSGVDEESRALLSTVQSMDDPDLTERVETYVADLGRNIDSVQDGLESSRFGTFDILWYALSFDYSRQINAGRNLQAEVDDQLSEEASQRIEGVLDALRFFGPAREHFKTLYFQWELINLSRALLYISVPALATMAIFVMYIDASTFTGTTLGIDDLALIMSAGFVVGIAPFVVFTVFILRIATVAQRTLAMGPFILRDREDQG